MKFSLRHSLAALATLGTLASFNASAAPQCELDREVRLAGLGWMSNLVTVEIERFIIEQGYGCDTSVEPGDTLPMLAAVARGDVDIDNEVWVNSVAEVWSKAEAEGKVKTLGNTYSGGVEGWYVPRYMVDKHPELTSVSVLADYKDLFADPEEPGKGRFYTCPAGWSCEITNANLMKAFGLDDDYTLFAAGSGAALDAAISSHIKRKRNILFYYWAPSAIVGKYDLVKLDMPAHDPAGHACNISSECETPYAGAFPVADIKLGVNSSFTEQAPQLTEFLTNFNIPTDTVNKLLAWADEQGAEPDEVARYFLENYPQLWMSWLPAETAERVKAAL